MNGRRGDNDQGRGQRIPSGVERPTMADVARQAGVSKITVSRALRGDPAVRPETLEKVVAIAKSQGYRVNLPARNLRQNRSRTVSVVVEMAPLASGAIADPYPLDLLRGISQELTRNGYSLLLATASDLDTPPLQAAEGAILLGEGADDSALRAIQDSPIPWVVWGADRPGNKYPVVGSDNWQGGAIAARHLLQTGHRRPVFLGDTHHAELSARQQGFEQVLREAGLTLAAARACDFTVASGAAATTALLKEGVAFDSVMASSDLIAMGAIIALTRAGRRIPEDVSVIGYDDTPMGATFAPPLTSVHQNWREGGALLARKTIDLIEGREARSEMLPASLTVRAT